MKCLIGPHGLYFSRAFVDRLYADTGTQFFDEPYPKAEWFKDYNASEMEINETEFLSRYEAIIDGDNIFFLDNDTIPFRTSPIVINIVQELNHLAFKNKNRDGGAPWKIIDIPEDCVNFSIGSEDDGSEWIYEHHRIWQ